MEPTKSAALKILRKLALATSLKIKLKTMANAISLIIGVIAKNNQTLKATEDSGWRHRALKKLYRNRSQQNHRIKIR
jgi:hypothetical protein